MATAWILTPIFEEVWFRGLIFQFLRKRFHLLAALLASSLLFAMVHEVVSTQHLSIFFLYGVEVVVIYVWTGSLTPAILAHVGWNILVDAFVW